MSEQPQEVEAPETDDHVDNDDLSEDQIWDIVNGPEVDVSDDEAADDKSRSK